MVIAVYCSTVQENWGWISTVLKYGGEAERARGNSMKSKHSMSMS